MLEQRPKRINSRRKRSTALLLHAVISVLTGLGDQDAGAEGKVYLGCTVLVGQLVRTTRGPLEGARKYFDRKVY